MYEIKSTWTFAGTFFAACGLQEKSSHSLGADTRQKQPSAMLQQCVVCSDIPECIWCRGTY